MLRNLTHALLLILTFTCSKGQSSQFRFFSIDANQGLSHNQIKSIYKDSRGFMWFGTISGLNRYDGYTIRVFRNNPRDQNSIVSDDVNKMFEDPFGNMWLSTWSGLDIYNPKHETFRHDPAPILKALNLPDANIYDMKKDKRGNYWILHQTSGLYVYNATTRTTSHLVHQVNDSSSIASNVVVDLQEDLKGDIWLVHKNGVIEKVSHNNFAVRYRNTTLKQFYKGALAEYRFIIDEDNDLWIYLAESNEGIYCFNPQRQQFTHYSKSNSTYKLSSDIVRGVVEDNNRNIWVATDHGGVNVINKKKNYIHYLVHSSEDKHSISQNSINVIYKDTDGIIWTGSFKSGISYYHENIIRFPLHQHNPKDPSSLPFNDINAFAEDHQGNLYIGTNGGGLMYYNRTTNSYKQYLHNPQDKSSLSNNVIVSLCVDHKNVLWIGTYFGGMCSFDGQKFTRYQHSPTDSTSISDYSVWEIFEDSKHRLWLGTLKKGIDVFDASRKKIRNYQPFTPFSIHASYVPVFMEDSDGNIWAGTGYGIEVMEKQTGKFTHYLSEPKNVQSLSNNSILSIIEDSRGLIWIGTHGGLNLFNKKDRTFSSFSIEDGLPNNSVLTIIEDDKKNLWLGTANGLTNVVIKRWDGESVDVHFVNYDEVDGLQGKQFNENAVLKTSKGEILFAGANGFNMFYPSQIKSNESRPKTVITNVELFNKKISVGEKNGILKESITTTDELVLHHDDNVFSIEFAALSFLHPERNLYKYRLKGFNKDWLTTDASQRKVTYTNLDPGDYEFQVLASNNDGVWNEEGVSVKIKVLPPFWRTPLAAAIYVVIILVALLLTRRMIQARERIKFAIEQERKEVQRVHELDVMKIRFFTNVSHEFRTPLTLILTPIERLLKETTDEKKLKQFQVIHRNAKRLMNLVNQLLDFRKLEVQRLKFTPNQGDIITFLRDTVTSFFDLSEKKSIQLTFNANVEHVDTVFDKDKLEKILFNLLSNAFKFTEEGGQVNVDVIITNGNGSPSISIAVSDTGIGIPADKLDKIFDRFFQSELPKSMVNQGSGIGLSITKEFVRLHNGTIEAKSVVGKGTTFTVVIPVIDPKAVTSVMFYEESVEEGLVEEDQLTSAEGADNNLPSLLLVEDNEDFRFYLKDNLQLQYRVFEARDGKEALQKALSLLPDLIVSDVMMPEMDGLELCKKLKLDQRVSHIPVILLTARNEEEQKLEGFDAGADDYITKPFNFEILQSRIRNLIHQRELFHKGLSKKVEVKASTINITSLDEKLIQNAIRYVEEKIADPDFSVEDLSKELGMSRVHLYKKLQALTGKSPLEFIRTIRLQHAAQLLEKSQLTVSEVAYKVGFNNPKYFARYFKEEYHVLPSAYAAGKRNKE